MSEFGDIKQGKVYRLVPIRESDGDDEWWERFSKHNNNVKVRTTTFVRELFSRSRIRIRRVDGESFDPIRSRKIITVLPEELKPIGRVTRRFVLL